jgi:hypothetical protein
MISPSEDKTPERGGNDGAPVTVFPVLKNQTERSPWLPTFICSAQAHPSMRKCRGRTIGEAVSAPPRDKVLRQTLRNGTPLTQPLAPMGFAYLRPLSVAQQ